jgi:ribose transport system substrate-binding protein
MKAVKAGTLDATMVQQTQKMGRLATQSACDLIQGKKLPPTQLQTAVLLTSKDTAKATEYIAQHP